MSAFASQEKQAALTKEKSLVFKNTKTKAFESFELRIHCLNLCPLVRPIQAWGHDIETYVHFAGEMPLSKHKPQIETPGLPKDTK